MATATLTDFENALAVAANLTSPVNANTWNAAHPDPGRYNGTQAVIWQNGVGGSFRVQGGNLEDAGGIPAVATITKITLSFDYSITISDWAGANPLSLRGGSPSQVTTGHQILDFSGDGTYTGTYEEEQVDMLPISRASLFASTWWWQLNRPSTAASGVDTSITVSNYRVIVEYATHMGYVIPSPVFHADDANGNPLVGGLLHSYEAGTDTPLATYSDQELNTENTNPVELDASGNAIVFIPDGTLYKFILENADGDLQWTVDGVSVPAPEAPPEPGVVPTGSVFAFAAAAAPSGYLLCDGSAVSRTTFDDLFGVIGTVYGAGDGTTTFNVPDLRGKFALGKAAAGTGSSLAATGGAIDHTHTGPDHTHAAGTLATGGPSGTFSAVGSGTLVGDGTHTHAITGSTATGGTGNTGTANPPFLVVQMIIKT